MRKRLVACTLLFALTASAVVWAQQPVTITSGTITLPSGASTSANQSTIIGHLDGVEALLTTIDADTGGIATSVDGVEALLTTIDSVLDAIDATLTDISSTLALDADYDLPGKTTGPQLFGLFDDTSPDSVDEGDAGSLRISANRNLFVTLRDAAGNERGLNIDASGNIAVTQSGTWNVGTLTTFPDNEPFNLAQIAGTTTAVNNGAVSAGVQRVTIANDSTGVLASIGSITTSVVPGGGATHLGKAEDAGHTTGDTGVFVMGRRIDTLAASSGTSADYEALNMNALGAVWTSPVPGTNGGLAIHRSIDLDEGTGEVVKASAGQVYAAWVTNTSTGTRWIKFYNATSCTMGTGTPVITVGIPGNSTDDIAGNLGPGAMGIAFDTGICVGATTGVADADTGAPGANDVIVNIYYK